MQEPEEERPSVLVESAEEIGDVATDIGIDVGIELGIDAAIEAVSGIGETVVGSAGEILGGVLDGI